jgi:putative DNA primase/helicase
MTARFMRAEFFEFMPEFKLWLATNHKPTVRGDAALWRRLKLIPFDYSIPKDQQKKRSDVMAMFQAELPGILNWAIQGCLGWRRDGLGVPEEVVQATEQYEEEQDTFAMFLEERCIVTPNARTLSLPLYRAYKAWAEEHGEVPVTHKTFASIMSERGFTKKKERFGTLYFGVGLRDEDHCDDAQAAQGRPKTASPFRDEDGEPI